MITKESDVNQDVDYPLDPPNRLTDFLDWAEIKSSFGKSGGYYTLVPAAKFSEKELSYLRKLGYRVSLDTSLKWKCVYYAEWVS